MTAPLQVDARAALTRLARQFELFGAIWSAAELSAPVRYAKRLGGNLAADVRRAKQRLSRGWDDRSVWSLDQWLARTLGAQLTYMADIAHGWPGDYDGGFDQWVADLRSNGAALLRYAENRVEDIDDPTAYVNAQQSMRWVADNFGALWD